LLTSRASSSTLIARSRQLALANRGRQQPGRPEQHDQHECQPEDQHADHLGVDQHPAEQRVLRRLDGPAQDLGHERKQQRPQDHAPDVAHAAEHDHRNHHHRLDQHEAFGRDEPLDRGEHSAGDAAERRAHRECEQLHVRRVDAHRARRDLVFADRLPGAADSRVLHPHVDDDEREHHEEQQVVILHRADQRESGETPADREIDAAEPERIDQREALRPVGDVDRPRKIVEEDPHDLAEAERDDRKVVAAQLQRWRAEQNAEEGRDRSADRQDDPEREMQPEVRPGEKRVGVRADRVERDIAQVEQACEADHNVEPQREQHIQDCEVRDANPGRADLD
jgi:hypothetical protein